MVPYLYAVYWLRQANSAFSFARKCNWLAEIVVIRCVMRHAWRHKLQRFRLKWTYCLFPILWLEVISLTCFCSEHDKRIAIRKVYSLSFLNELEKQSLKTFSHLASFVRYFDLKYFESSAILRHSLVNVDHWLSCQKNMHEPKIRSSFVISKFQLNWNILTTVDIY